MKEFNAYIDESGDEGIKKGSRWIKSYYKLCTKKVSFPLTKGSY